MQETCNDEVTTCQAEVIPLSKVQETRNDKALTCQAEVKAHSRGQRVLAALSR